MDDHPPTERQLVTGKRTGVRWRLVVVFAFAMLAAVVGAIVMRQPDVVVARSPGITTVPAGVSITFNSGRWTNASLALNGGFTCNVGDLEPGAHVIAWNRFGGPTSPPLSQPLVRTVTLQGEVDGEPRVINCTVTMGQGFVASSYVDED